jgi:hypothetical protein
MPKCHQRLGSEANKSRSQKARERRRVRQEKAKQAEKDNGVAKAFITKGLVKSSARLQRRARCQFELGLQKSKIATQTAAKELRLPSKGRELSETARKQRENARVCLNRSKHLFDNARQTLELASTYDEKIAKAVEGASYDTVVIRKEKFITPRYLIKK